MLVLTVDIQTMSVSKHLYYTLVHCLTGSLMLSVCIDSTILHVSSLCGQCHQVQPYYNSVVLFAMVMVCSANKDIGFLSLLP